ncbi:hypothetical protein CFter6_1914 [Collimonas fungivorans]|uniref:Uncharacterized protein n=1 Tax=Collimonas fungivorans TaxID=158899 RepID=A0A127P9V6_9BURK|nr:hypothetical protein CFter6_1914 [Collimonas fungivorans]
MSQKILLRWQSYSTAGIQVRSIEGLRYRATSTTLASCSFKLSMRYKVYRYSIDG